MILFYSGGQLLAIFTFYCSTTVIISIVIFTLTVDIVACQNNTQKAQVDLILFPKLKKREKETTNTSFRLFLNVCAENSCRNQNSEMKNISTTITSGVVFVT